MDTMVKGCLDYLDEGVSPFHAVEASARRLDDAGFTRLEESQPWSLEKGGKYYTTRNGSSLIAWRMPRETLGGWRGAAAHSDSPTYRITATKVDDPRYARARVEGYGGMRPATWIDRPLTMAGRVLVRTENGVETRLVCPDKDLLCIPSVCVHFDRDGAKGGPLNAATDLQPIFGAKGADLAREIAGAGDVLQYDLVLVPRQKAVTVGMNEEFFMAPRIDDLGAAYATLQGFLAGRGSDDRGDLWCLFDNEEVGSGTRQGALSNFLSSVLARAEQALGVTAEQHVCAQANTLMLSADNAHATHPNHPELSDSAHPVTLNGGVVVKYNASQKYTTSALTGALFGEICRRAEVPVQPYYNRPDMPGGSTLGNLLSWQNSVAMVDIGMGQLAMHSAVETAGCEDVVYMAKAVAAFYNTRLAQPTDGNWTIAD